MTISKHKYAVIVAGGSGQRMNSAIPKQFLQLNGATVLSHTINAFLQAFPEIKIVLVLPAVQMDHGRKIVEALPLGAEIRLVAGGENRFHSVRNGLQYIDRNSIVFVHDGVRCLVSAELIRRCYALALEKGNAIPAMHPADSVRWVNGGLTAPIPRNDCWLIQTPQTFQADILLNAFAQPYEEAFTDEATVVQKMGIVINIIEGEATNIKLTVPADMLLAEAILKERNTVRTPQQQLGGTK